MVKEREETKDTVAVMMEEEQIDDQRKATKDPDAMMEEKQMEDQGAGVIERKEKDPVAVMKEEKQIDDQEALMIERKAMKDPGVVMMEETKMEDQGAGMIERKEKKDPVAGMTEEKQVGEMFEKIDLVEQEMTSGAKMEFENFVKAAYNIDRTDGDVDFLAERVVDGDNDDRLIPKVVPYDVQQEGMLEGEKKRDISSLDCNAGKEGKQDKAPTMFYHLKQDNKRLFKAVVAEKENPDRKKLKEDEELFIIRGVYINKAMKWKRYNPVSHAINCTIAWKLKGCVKLKVQIPVQATSRAYDVTGAEEVERGRKRKRQISNQEIRKRKRNSGEEYVISNQKKDVQDKRVRPERQMKPPCACKKKCSEKISEGERREVFAAFWRLGDIDQQRQYVVNNTAKSAVKRRRIRDPENSTINRKGREATYNYNLRGVPVCKTMFLNTLDISEVFIFRSFMKASEGDVVLKDNRGRHQSNVLDPEVRKSVIEHIKSFPVMEAHYIRSDTKRKYFESNLNLSKLYDLYLEKMAGTSLKPASKAAYTNIFYHSFNIGFHRPKKDRCAICIKFENATEDEKEKMLPEYELHMESKEEARKLKTEIKLEAKSSNERVIAFDLQKVLNCPKGENNLFYYKRKLHCYNLTITDLVSGESYCYLWDQTQGSRGANEIASCMYAFINVHCEGEISKLTLFADNCPSQNKNRMVIQMISLALLHNTNIKAIQLIFLEVGHTQNENDTVHSLVERAMKGIDIYHPAQWNTLVAAAGKKKMLHVEPMCWLDFKNFSTPLGSTYSYLMESRPRQVNNVNKQVAIKWDEIMHVKIEQKKTMVIHYKHHFNEEHFQEGVIGFIPRTTSRVSEVNLHPPCVYRGVTPISRELFDDLKFLCDKNAIPPQFHEFYAGLKHK